MNNDIDYLKFGCVALYLALKLEDNGRDLENFALIYLYMIDMIENESNGLFIQKTELLNNFNLEKAEYDEIFVETTENSTLKTTNNYSKKGNHQNSARVVK